MLYIYPAVLYEEEDTFYMSFPDLDILAEGENAEEAFAKAKECLKAYFKLAKRLDVEVASPSTYEQISKKHPKNTVLMVDVNVNTKEISISDVDKEYNKFRKMFFHN